MTKTQKITQLQEESNCLREILQNPTLLNQTTWYDRLIDTMDPMFLTITPHEVLTELIHRETQLFKLQIEELDMNQLFEFTKNIPTVIRKEMDVPSEEDIKYMVVKRYIDSYIDTLGDHVKMSETGFEMWRV